MDTHSTKNDQDIYDIYAGHVNPSYPDFLRRLGLVNIATRAKGVYITDSLGNNYIDCTAGYGLYNLGHNPPQIVEALIEQLRSDIPLTKPFITEIQSEFARRITALAPEGLNYVFLCNSGSEAVDSALKLARLASRRKKIIAANGSFHGYTFGALSATGIKKFRLPFGPMVPDIEFINYGDLDCAAQAIDHETAAVILEPIQHEAGVNVPPEDYLSGIRKLCDQTGTLLIIDEVKTGMGKTGHLFASTANGARPDILVLGKSLGGGVIPSGAILATNELWQRFSLSFPMSASSFAGNALACRAAVATLDTFTDTDILDNCRANGQILAEFLATICEKYPHHVSGTAGQGLIHGLRLVNPRIAFELSKQLVQRGVLAITAFGNGAELMIEPPIVISTAELTQVTRAIENALDEI